jgi:subtilisin family serine protease
MKNQGQRDPTGRAGKAGADIKATEAWARATGSKNVVVAVIDTGVDYNHPDIRPNMWIKPKANPSDPDVFGFNAINGKEDPMDDNAHGTHCAGTIGAVGDNAQGVVGVTWNVSIMGVKFLSGSGSGTLADAIKAIDYATQNGAQIMSNSWGGGGFSQTLLDAIKRARDKGILFVAAAGNDGSNNDSQPAYPASYDVDNIISVAASNNLDNMASFSNFGTRTVHLMAPGENILSTTPNNRYQSFSGTSMATPHVSGAAALLLGQEPSLDYTELRERILKSTDKWKGLKRKVASSGRLNVYNMLAQIFPPGPIQIPDSAWNVPVPQNIRTPSPYKENTQLSWTIENPGVKFMRIRFARFSTEAGYDIVTIKDKDGNVVDQLSGNLAANTWSSEVEGDKLIIEFKSDESVPGEGFTIDAYQWTNFGSN